MQCIRVTYALFSKCLWMGKQKYWEISGPTALTNDWEQNGIRQVVDASYFVLYFLLFCLILCTVHYSHGCMPFKDCGYSFVEEARQLNFYT